VVVAMLAVLRATAVGEGATSDGSRCAGIHTCAIITRMMKKIAGGFAGVAFVLIVVFFVTRVTSSTVDVYNDTDAGSVVYIAFGSDSVVLPAGPTWAFCPTTTRLNCSFPLAAKSKQELPLNGKYFNATLTVNSPVTCASTKAEININNPNWYDITDVSLVDGYSNELALEIDDAKGTRTLGPPKGAHGNENVYGLFPLGCDICVARQQPPCGFVPGGTGCKAGTQYNPTPPCQYQGPTLHGGSRVRLIYSGER
jgi:hypothetical protein